MKITDKWINKYQPCQDAIIWGRNKGEYDSYKILNCLIKENRLDWANWFIVRLMTHKQKIQYAIFAAEQVLNYFEDKYPDDNRPRKAIDAAKKCLNNPSNKNKSATYAAADAAYAAAYAADATHAATYAAAAAHAAAYAAAHAATYAADAAYAAAHAAAYAAAYAKMKKNIIKYGIKLLRRK